MASSTLDSDSAYQAFSIDLIAEHIFSFADPKDLPKFRLITQTTNLMAVESILHLHDTAKFAKSGDIQKFLSLWKSRGILWASAMRMKKFVMVLAPLSIESIQELLETIQSHDKVEVEIRDFDDEKRECLWDPDMYKIHARINKLSSKAATVLAGIGHNVTSLTLSLDGALKLQEIDIARLPTSFSRLQNLTLCYSDFANEVEISEKDDVGLLVVERQSATGLKNVSIASSYFVGERNQLVKHLPKILFADGREPPILNLDIGVGNEEIGILQYLTEKAYSKILDLKLYFVQGYNGAHLPELIQIQSNLKSLVLSDSFGINTRFELPRCEKLEYLALQFYDWSHRPTLTGLSNERYQKLKKVVIYRGYQNLGSTFVGNFPTVESLKVQCADITTHCYHWITKFPNLNHLEILIGRFDRFGFHGRLNGNAGMEFLRMLFGEMLKLKKLELMVVPQCLTRWPNYAMDVWRAVTGEATKPTSDEIMSFVQNFNASMESEKGITELKPTIMKNLQELTIVATRFNQIDPFLFLSRPGFLPRLNLKILYYSIGNSRLEAQMLNTRKSLLEKYHRKVKFERFIPKDHHTHITP